VTRQPREKVKNPGGAYFAVPTAPMFFPSGCALLDCVLAGGWVHGRISNIIGDKSTGKTLLAIEASANFAKLYPKGTIHYNEVEAAFDRPYAQALGMPIDRIRFSENCFTVEDVFKDMQWSIDHQPKGQPGLYILDSLDAVSDQDELDRGFGEASYGMKKPKLLGELFRRLVQGLAGSQIHVMIISQVRDKIGVTFGRKWTRAGGHAMDHYASQIIYLAQVKSLKKTYHGVERTVGIRVKAKCEKNKAGLAFRECEFPIMFGYGIDDVVAMLEWLVEVKSENLDIVRSNLKVGKAAGVDEILDQFQKMDNATFAEERTRLEQSVKAAWGDIEIGFLPERNKYGD